jgi:hypothetical protein
MPAARVWGPWGRSGTCRVRAGRRVSGVREVVCASSRRSLGDLEISDALIETADLAFPSISITVVVAH